jgi:hypothetical protein
MRFLDLCFGLVIILFSCKKETAITVQSQLEGTWKHHSDKTHTVFLQIGADSKGYIEYYENNEFKSDTQFRKWLIKNNFLYFGWLAGKEEKFSIDLSPSIATFEFIKQYDTIEVGQRYIVLNGSFYVE